ncbi:MAG: hypothetical protein V1244_07960 [Nitrospinaceae bacterium]|jgi:hypothetical protein|nr:hypothetical protein [Nitrospinaceae bacterium]
MDVPTVWAECLVSPTRAQAILRPGVMRRFFLLLSGRLQVLKTETIHLPFCLLRYELENSKSQQGISILVDGYRREARHMKEAELRLSDRPDDAEEFPYPMDREETMEIARNYISSLRMARTFSPGVTFGREPAIKHVIQYPFCVVYRQAAGDSVKFDMVDGLTGKRGGTLANQAFLAALYEENPAIIEQKPS